MMFYSQTVQSVPKSWRIHKVHLVMQPHDFVCFWDAFAAPCGAVGCVGEGCLGGTSRAPAPRGKESVDAKKEACQKDSRIRGTKEWSSEKISGSSGCCRRKDFRIKGTKEWSREKIPGSGGQSGKKNKTKSMKQRKDFRIRQRCIKRMPGSGGQKNGAEKRFQDQAVDAQKERNREKIPGSGRDASKGLKDQGDKRMEQRKDSRIRRSMRKKEQNKTNKTEKRFQHQPEVRQKGLQDQGDKRMKHRKHSRIR
jgi:hypothetical protein